VARWLVKVCAFSALLRVHVPCGVRIGVEVCVNGFSFLVVFHSGVRGCETMKKLLDVCIFVLI
jgi:hypothetical protein